MIRVRDKTLIMVLVAGLIVKFNITVTKRQLACGDIEFADFLYNGYLCQADLRQGNSHQAGQPGCSAECTRR